MRRAGGILAVLLVLTSPAGAQEPDESRLREAARLRSAALVAIEEGDYEAALGPLRTLAEILPGNVLPAADLAICHLRLGHRQAALAEVARARQLAPDNPNVLHTLARLLEEDPESRDTWDEVVAHFAATHSRDPRPHYLRARRLRAEGRPAEAAASLREALHRDADNLVLMVELLVAGAEAEDAEAVGDAVDAIEDRMVGFTGHIADHADQLRDRLDAGATDGLAPRAVVLQNLLRPTELYQIGLPPLVGRMDGRGLDDGVFVQRSFEPPLPESVQGGRDVPATFVEATGESGLGPVAEPRLLLRLPERQGDAALALTSSGAYRIAPGPAGPVARAIPWAHAETPAGPAVAFDFTGDGVSDLAAVHSDGAVLLHPGDAGGAFGPPTRLWAPPDGAERPAPILLLAPLEVDHDGDLDLLVGRAGAAGLYLRNDGDGTWSELAAELGLDAADRGISGAALADFDRDADLDLLTVAAGPPRLLLNRRAGSLEDASAPWGLGAVAGGQHEVRLADVDGDERLDAVLWGGPEPRLLLARGGSFEAAALPEGLGGEWSAAAVGDWDNDGDPDLAVVPAETGALLFVRNRGGVLAVEETGVTARGVQRLVPGDFDGDGGLDLLAHTASGLRFWANRGGSENHWLRLALVGKSENNGKNNPQALFVGVEVLAGGRTQVVQGHGGVNHLGLGAELEADVVRVTWTNGLTQTWPLVAADQTLLEEQVLKGSCPFLYTWDGRGFRFVTDLLWPSPLGMVLADGTPAPHESARDYVAIPGEALAPVDGELWLQVTEELWETVYLDGLHLLAVDHPAELEMVVDERLVPGPRPRSAPIHWLADRLAPVAARDEEGRDVLERIRARDGRHVDRLPLGRYQGLTEGHALELTFDGVPASGRLRLVLHGWIFPTDTSINRALAQDETRALRGPILELLVPGAGAGGGDGDRWRTLSPFIGLPNGKRKAMVVDLTDRLPPGRVTLRIATTQQVYWDAAALAHGEPSITPAVTRLDPAHGDLHYRGFSRLYRESATGPHLFDYRTVSLASPFRPVSGAFTRYGEVTDLLLGEDSRSVVLGAGDELTVRFDARSLPSLRAGWRRDWILFTDGWVKDADLNTMHSQTVEPMPYHGMSAYPDRPGHRFPRSPEERSYLERYQTRIVGAGDGTPPTPGSPPDR